MLIADMLRFRENFKKVHDEKSEGKPPSELNSVGGDKTSRSFVSYEWNAFWMQMKLPLSGNFRVCVPRKATGCPNSLVSTNKSMITSP